MKKQDLPQDLLAEVKELLERADFVKFAKFVASDDDNASVLPLAVRFITETYQTDLDSERASAEVQDDKKEGGEE